MKSLSTMQAKIEKTDDVNDLFSESTEFSNLLQPLLKELKWPGEYRNITDAIPYHIKSLDLTGFRNVLATLHYKSEHSNTNINALDKELLPCIFLAPDKPAMLVKEINNDKFTVYDSKACEDKVLENPDIKGEIYVFKPLEKDEKRQAQEFNWFAEMIQRFKPLLWQVLLASFLYNLFLLAPAIYVMQVYDQVLSTSSPRLLINFTIGVSIVLAGIVIMLALRAKIVAYISSRLDKIVGEMIIERLLYLPTSYTENATVGSQIARIRDFDNIREFVTSQYVSVIFELPYTILFLAIIWFVGGSLIFIPMIMILAFYIIYKITIPYIKRASEMSALTQHMQQGFLIETLSNLRTIKVNGVSDLWYDRYRELTAKMVATSFKSSLYTQVLNSFSVAIMYYSGLCIVGFGTYKVMSGTLSIGGLLATMLITWRTIGPVKTFFSILPRLNQVRSSIQQVNKLMKIPMERSEVELVKPVKSVQGRVDFTRISFRYRPDSRPAMMGVSFSAEPGQVISIVGRNGSGKSTLLKLILGLYKPAVGNIFLDSVNINQMDPIGLRHAVAYLPQKPDLFYGTIEQNIMFGNPVATRDEVEAATKLAGVYDEIEILPDGFQTQLKDKCNDSYSSTFIQKLALARTYLKQSKLILLDEPTNRLDDEDRKTFHNAIEKLRGRSTIIIATHQPTIINISDKILYLEYGQLLADGPPSEVLPKLTFNPV